MADDQFNSSTNWWNRSRFETGTGGTSASSSSTTTTSSGVTSLCNFLWPTEIGDVKGRSSLESVSVSESNSVELHMMGLGLSSQAMEWNQALLRGEEGENSFRSMIQENLSASSNNYPQETGIGSSQHNWRDQINRGFTLDQPQFSPHGRSSDSNITCQGLQTIDPSAAAANMYGCPSTVFQGLLGHENEAQHSSFERSLSTYPYGGSYGVGSSDQLLPSWSKVPQMFRNSPPKQYPISQLHFSNNAPFWNASASTTTSVRPSFFPSLQPQFPSANFEEKPKIISEVRDSSAVAKKSSSETSTKRPRNETASPLPTSKVRKEKTGDRITALQQLVSPFGKTDTASVLSEAIEYIKFLHEQVSVLSTPYMKSGAPIHQQQSTKKSKDPEGQKQDLKSRGLCLVPVSSTFPVTHETTVNFWNPTFGGTFR